MKKAVAALLALCLMISAAVLAEEAAAPFTIREGITFGMSRNDLTAALNGVRYEIDKEDTRIGLIFTQVEVEHTTVNGLRADVQYLLLSDRLAAVRVEYDDDRGVYDQVRSLLTGTYGEASAVDAAALGNAIYAVDDDGRLDSRAECWTAGNVAIVLEMDEDEATVTLVDLTAAF